MPARNAVGHRTQKKEQEDAASVIVKLLNKTCRKGHLLQEDHSTKHEPSPFLKEALRAAGEAPEGSAGLGRTSRAIVSRPRAAGAS